MSEVKLKQEIASKISQGSLKNILLLTATDKQKRFNLTLRNIDLLIVNALDAKRLTAIVIYCIKIFWRANYLQK